MANTYSGSLRPKRKGELQTIAKEMGVKLDEGTKVEFEAEIRSALRANKSLQRDPRFVELWKSILEGEQRRSSARAKSEAAQSETGEVEESDAEMSNAPTPNRALRHLVLAASATGEMISQNAAEYTQQATEMAQEAVQYAQEQVYDGALVLQDNLPESAGQMILHADEEAAKYGHALVRWSQKRVVPQLGAAQKLASSSWNIIAFTLLLEVFFMVITTVPYTRQVHVEAWKWAFFQFTPDHPWSVTVPDMAVLAQYSFWRVLGVWTFTTIVLPGIISQLVVFPRPQAGLQPASPVTFSIVRLALDLYLHKIAQGPSFDWANSVIQRFAGIQILSAGTALAFAVYEALAH